ncbi:MAG: response regulator [Cyanobacteria bacterium J06629_2]
MMHHNSSAILKKRKYQPTILVVEDDSDNLTYIAAALERLDCHCLTARNAMEGLSIAQKWQPGLLLVDIEMTGVSGIELLKILRLDWLTRTIPVVAVTALSEDRERDAIAQAGFDDCLLKPYSLAELEILISAYFADASLI